MRQHINKIISTYPSRLLILMAIGIFIHFVNIGWGAPYFFHPDERNIANAVSQLSYPSHMNPSFFAYGSLPIYVIYFTGLILHLAQYNHTLLNQVSFTEAILLSRFFSALLATLLIPLVYFCGYKLKDKQTGFLGALFVTSSVGIIQFAHFGTFEMWLTFFSVLLFYFSLRFIKNHTMQNALGMAIIFGILIAIKVTTISLIPVVLVIYGVHILRITTIKKKLLMTLSYLGMFLGMTLFIYILTNPYVLLDTKSFSSSMQYESGVGLGTLPVFYTQGFYATVPLLYQIFFVYPFLINPVMTLLLPISFISLLMYLFKNKNLKLVLLLLYFFVLLLSQSFFFVKWTRYIVPTIPFLSLMIAFFLQTFMKKMNTKIQYLLLGILMLTNIIFGFSYLKTVYLSADTRLVALDFAKTIIPQNAHILSEMYDLGIIVFNPLYPNITLYNTYDLDSGSYEFNESTWKQQIKNSSYVILPSQRVLQTRMQMREKYPVGNAVYTSLLNGSSGFKRIYQTPCDIYCKITYLGNPIYYFEQTSSVFDRPTVMIFQKIF